MRSRQAFFDIDFTAAQNAFQTIENFTIPASVMQMRGFLQPEIDVIRNIFQCQRRHNVTPIWNHIGVIVVDYV